MNTPRSNLLEVKEFQNKNVIERYIRLLKEKLKEVDISDIEFNDYFDEVDITNNAFTLYNLIKLRSSAVKANEEIDENFDTKLKLLLSNEDVYNTLVSLFSKAKTESEITKSHLYKKYEELKNESNRLTSVFDLLAAVSNRGLKPKGLKLRELTLLSSDQIKKLLDDENNFDQHLTEADRELIKNTFIPKTNVKLRDINTQQDSFFTLESSKGEIRTNSISHQQELCKVEARVQYEKLLRYRDESKNDGFVWTESRKQILHEVVETLATGKVPVIVGESGTGKSTFANHAAQKLTGYETISIPCTPEMSPAPLFSGTREFRDDQSYQKYGSVVQAFTGYENSLQEEPTYKAGRFARFEEYNFSGKKIYSSLKYLFEKKPGDTLEGQKILEGSGLIFTSNPSGPRYIGREEPDLALKRHLTEINVDYIPQPELYDFMVACLMDENGMIKPSLEEISPAYSVFEFERDGVRYQTTRKSYVESDHGYLYRMSKAFRLIQDAYNQYNSDTFIEGNLRVTQEYNPVKIKLQITPKDSDGEPLKIVKEVLTPKDIKNILEAHQEGSFTEVMILELKKYLNERVKRDDDRQVIEAIFNYYGLLENNQTYNTKTTCTPEDIGFLSPSVQKPIRELAVPTTVLTLPEKVFTQNKEILRYNREGLELDTEYLYPGDEEYNKLILLDDASDRYLPCEYLGLLVDEDGNNTEIGLFKSIFTEDTEYFTRSKFNLDEYNSYLSVKPIEGYFNLEKLYSEYQLCLMNYLESQTEEDEYSEFVSFYDVVSNLTSKLDSAMLINVSKLVITPLSMTRNDGEEVYNWDSQNKIFVQRLLNKNYASTFFDIYLADDSTDTTLNTILIEGGKFADHRGCIDKVITEFKSREKYFPLQSSFSLSALEFYLKNYSSPFATSYFIATENMDNKELCLVDARGNTVPWPELLTLNDIRLKLFQKIAIVEKYKRN